MEKAKSFTFTYSRLEKVLRTHVDVGDAYDPSTSTAVFKRYVGIWDTGATASVITAKIITECSLKPISMTKAHGADGEYLTEVFLISLMVPNGLGFHSMRVTRGKLPSGSDMLVGMDVIGSGDFAVTNYSGVTSFSFRHPSLEKICFLTSHTSAEYTPPPKPKPQDCGGAYIQ